MKRHNSRRFKQVAFIFSISLFALWTALGMGTSLAWFTDTSSELKNIFHVADFDLQVFHRLENGGWEEVEEDTELFDDSALYEPGYTEIVYLKIKNNGEVPFNWQTAVSVYKFTEGINYFGDTFNLQDHLLFGIVEGKTFEELKEKVKTRELCRKIAVEELNYYSTTSTVLDNGKEAFLAIVVRMPEEVTNVANYKPPHQPEVNLNVIVSATQIRS